MNTGEHSVLRAAQLLISQTGLLIKITERRNPAGDVELLVVNIKSKARDQVGESGPKTISMNLSDLSMFKSESKN